MLGGAAAEAYDARIALADDAKLIVPLVLILVLAIVGVMVRAFVAPLYLVATVVLSYAFALGASSLLFTHVLGQPASDPALPTFAFVFLVALGVDYNVFLISRIREEREHRDAQDAVISGLERSGGVITSAGLILAGTFLALVAVDMVSLAQVGFTVAFGLLVDTFLVRCFLVPAIAVKLGDRSWWPLPPAAQVAVGAVAAARGRVRLQPARRGRDDHRHEHGRQRRRARCARRSSPPRPRPPPTRSASSPPARSTSPPRCPTCTRP